MKQVKLWLDRYGDTGETGVSWCLQVGNNTALVPQQAAMAQFDGGNELSSTALCFVTGWKSKIKLVSGFCPDIYCHVDGRQLSQIPLAYCGPV